MDETVIPEPPDSGSDGSQVVADITSQPKSAQPLGGALSTTVAGLAANNSRAFGGGVSSALIAGVVSQISHELNDSKQEVARLRLKIENVTKELSDERVRSAVLKERVDSYRSARHLTNIVLVLGTLLLGVGIQLILASSYAYGGALFAVGSLLVIASWIYVPKRGAE